MRIGSAVVVVALLLGMVRADEAVQRDGRALKGALSLEKTGKLQITTADRRVADLEDGAEVRLDGGPPPIFRGAPGKLLRLTNGQSISGVFVGLEKNNLIFETAWADRLAVPRSAVVALTHQPGWQPLNSGDFADKHSGWKTTGAPEIKDGSALLGKPGQSLTWDPRAPVAEGRLAVNFREEGPLAGARWTVEAAFSVKGGERVVRVEVAGGEALSVDSGGLAGPARRVARADGWRRLVIDFTTGSLRIRVDDGVLWYTLDEGPGGPLQRVKLSCSADKPATVRGGVSFAAAVIERAVDEKRRPPGDPGQDELWLAGGDQLFGQVVGADRRGIELKGRFGVKRLAWTAVRGWFPRAEKPPVAAPGGGPNVRLRLRSGLRPTLDELEGRLDALDAKHVTIRHPLLGKITLPRVHVARLKKLP
jgi:hypothetical protein